jgi:K+-transporting ATPase c subunit
MSTLRSTLVLVVLLTAVLGLLYPAAMAEMAAALV